MKKITSFALVLTMLLTATIFSACLFEHKCVPSDTWSTDADSHWHECSDEKCEEILDKANHTWNEGVITTVASQKEDGVKTFTCTVCNATKTEAIPFTGMTKEEWNAAFDEKQFENFTFTETSVLVTTGMEIETISIYEFEKSKAKQTATIAGQTQSQNISSSQVATYRTALLKSFEPMVKFEDYKYDATTKTYVLDGEFTIPSLGVKADTATLTFEDGKLVKMTYTCVIVDSGVSFDVTSTVLFTDYGTTTID